MGVVREVAGKLGISNFVVKRKRARQNAVKKKPKGPVTRTAHSEVKAAGSIHRAKWKRHKTFNNRNKASCKKLI